MFSPNSQSAELLFIKDRLFLNDAVMVHRCLQDKAPEYLKEKFVKRQEVSGRNTRHMQRNPTPSKANNLLPIGEQKSLTLFPMT